MLSNMLTKGLAATVVWLESVPWLDLVGLGVGLVSVGSWEWTCGSGLVSVGLVGIDL
jgi:hypothetical protein